MNSLKTAKIGAKKKHLKVNKFLNKFLLVVNVILFCIMIVFWILSIFAELLNPPVFEKMLATLKIPLNYDSYVLVTYIILAALIIVYLIRKKFFDK